MASNEWLVRKLHEQDKKIEALSRGGTGVGHTSIAPGENLTVISEDGEVVLGAGGVEHVDGPTPATPSAPTLKLGFGTIETTWDGSFVGGEDEDGVPLTAPVDFDVVEVHCSTDPEEEEWGADTMRGQIKTREGGTITVGGFDVDDEVFVCLIALAKTGKRSAPSVTASLVIEGLDFAQLTNELDAATVTIDNAREVLLDGQNTLGEKLDAADTALSDLETTLSDLDSTTLPALRSDLDAAEGRLSTAEGQITDAFGQIVDVRSDAAADATSKANAAEQNAKSAAQQYDTALKGQIDSTINQAKADLTADINAVRTSANGKNSVTWSTSTPPTSYSGAVSDTWFVMSGAGSGATVLSQWRWNGNVWVSTKLSQAVLAQIDIGTGTFGEMDGARLKAGSIYADRIVSGLSQNMVPDPGFANQTISNARLSAANFYEMTVGISDGILWFETPSTATLDANISLASTGDLHGWSAYPGMKVISKIQAKTSNVGYFRLNIRYKNRDGSTGYRTMSPVGHTASGVWAEYVSSFTLPQEAVGYSIVIQVQAASRGRLEFRSPFSASSVSGTVIENGTVTTDNLAANVLEVGNLKAGVAAIAEAVVQKIAASTASIQQADVKNLFVTGTSSLSNVVAERIASETAQFIELEVGNLVAGTGTMDTATINKLFSDVVVASMAQAEQFIGENAILTGAVTAPKITASEELWAKIAEFVKIRAEHIAADAIDGMVITGPTIQSGRSGRRWVGDPNGIRIINEDEDVRTQLSPDGSVFKGEVEADTLVVNEGAEFKANNTLAQGAKLTLAAGVTDPTAPPTVQPYWGGLEANESLANARGLAWDGANYWTVNANAWGVSDRFIRINGSTGEVTRFDHAPALPNFSELFGVTCIGSELFWLYRSKYDHRVLVTDLNGVQKREFPYPYEDAGHSATNPLVYKPGIGNDGTNVVIAHCTDAGDLIFRTYNKTTGTKTSGVSTGENVASDIVGAYVGAGDFGSNHMVAARASNNSFIRYTMSGNRVDSGGWFSPDREDSTGIVYVDGKFRSLDPAGTITEYGDTSTGDESQYWWACYAWAEDFDDNGITETWSRPSPPKRFTWPRRAKLKILGQPLPDGVQMILPALAKKETVPVRTDFHSPTWEYVEGKSEAHYSTLPTDWETNPSPRDSNNFPEAEPSTIETTNKQFRVNGDGSGKWGPLTFFPNGSWSGAVVSGQVVITSPSANSTTSMEVTFPPGRFTNIPEVTTTVYSNSPRDVSVGVRDVSATSFTVNMFSTATGPRRIAWIAFDQGA